MDIIKIFSGGFPLTTERLIFLQETYAKAFEQITKAISNGDVIIDGATLDDENEPTTISDGVVIIGGEIMELRGGVYDDRIAIFEEVVNVPYNEDLDIDGDLDLKEADTVRFAQCHTTDGDDAITYDTLTRFTKLAAASVEVGDVKTSFNPVQNPNWLLCDGSILNAVDEPLLFALLGGSFGGNGTTTFALPNYQNRTSVGAGGDYALKATGGEKEITLTEGQLPAHTHSGSTSAVGDHTHNVRFCGGAHFDYTNRNPGGKGEGGRRTMDEVLDNRDTEADGGHSHTMNLDNTGNDEAHNNMQPFIAVNFYIFKGE